MKAAFYSRNNKVPQGAMFLIDVNISDDHKRIFFEKLDSMGKSYSWITDESIEKAEKKTAILNKYLLEHKK